MCTFLLQVASRNQPGVAFRSLQTDALHGGCPVIKGVNSLATNW